MSCDYKSYVVLPPSAVCWFAFSVCGISMWIGTHRIYILDDLASFVRNVKNAVKIVHLFYPNSFFFN